MVSAAEAAANPDAFRITPSPSAPEGRANILGPAGPAAAHAVRVSEYQQSATQWRRSAMEQVVIEMSMRQDSPDALCRFFNNRVCDDPAAARRVVRDLRDDRLEDMIRAWRGPNGETITPPPAMPTFGTNNARPLAAAFERDMGPSLHDWQPFEASLDSWARSTQTALAR